jgi:hypothetical protein
MVVSSALPIAMDISPNQATLDPAMAESADDASRESRYREAIKLYAPALAQSRRVRQSMFAAYMGLSSGPHHGHKAHEVAGCRRGRGSARSLDAYREELKRRRDYCWDAWRWSMWPIAPSILVMFVGGLVYDPRPNKLVHYGIMALFVVAFTLLEYGTTDAREMSLSVSCRRSQPWRRVELEPISNSYGRNHEE